MKKLNKIFSNFNALKISKIIFAFVCIFIIIDIYASYSLFKSINYDFSSQTLLKRILNFTYPFSELIFFYNTVFIASLLMALTSLIAVLINYKTRYAFIALFYIFSCYVYFFHAFLPGAYRTFLLLLFFFSFFPSFWSPKKETILSKTPSFLFIFQLSCIYFFVTINRFTPLWFIDNNGFRNSLSSHPQFESLNRWILKNLPHTFYYFIDHFVLIFEFVVVAMLFSLLFSNNSIKFKKALCLIGLIFHASHLILLEAVLYPWLMVGIWFYLLYLTDYLPVINFREVLNKRPKIGLRLFISTLITIMILTQNISRFYNKSSKFNKNLYKINFFFGLNQSWNMFSKTKPFLKTYDIIYESKGEIKSVFKENRKKRILFPIPLGAERILRRVLTNNFKYKENLVKTICKSEPLNAIKKVTFKIEYLDIVSDQIKGVNIQESLCDIEQ